MWKLRYLPKLHTLILSGNPLHDLFFINDDLDPNCACFCHHDDNEPVVVNIENDDSMETDLSDINTAVTDNEIHVCEWVESVDENGNESYPDDESVENWCKHILDDVIAELIQERFSALKNQKCPMSNENNKNNDTDISFCETSENNAGINIVANNRNNRYQNTRNKIENLTAGSYICMSSCTEESNKRSNSESSQCECYCNKDDLPEIGFPVLGTLCVSETHIGKWRHLSALNAFPSLKSLRIKVCIINVLVSN